LNASIAASTRNSAVPLSLQKSCAAIALRVFDVMDAMTIRHGNRCRLAARRNTTADIVSCFDLKVSQRTFKHAANM